MKILSRETVPPLLLEKQLCNRSSMKKASFRSSPKPIGFSAFTRKKLHFCIMKKQGASMQVP
jgi:hypothetical protein